VDLQFTSEQHHNIFHEHAMSSESTVRNNTRHVTVNSTNAEERKACSRHVWRASGKGSGGGSERVRKNRSLSMFNHNELCQVEAIR